MAYRIDVKLDPELHRLNAYLELDYLNNSPDTLHFIWMHLWPNAYKDKTSALASQQVKNGDLDLYYAREEDRGWIDNLDFKIDSAKVNWNYDPLNIDIAKVDLSTPLAPGEQITITTPFRVQFPDGRFSRMGHIGQAYMVTQWYPKPAVYDREGWHQMPYLDLGEFYSEFGTFDVRITLPKNYIVGATGDMVDGENELLWLDSIAASTKAGNIRDQNEYSPSVDTKTLHFHQEKVHDFAWFADMRYHVLKGEVELASGKKVVTWAMFTKDDADLWMNSIEYINDAVLHYSKWVGEYPYAHATAVDGTISAGGGMEYPNITVIGRSGSDFELEVVIAHEVGHNWFYGILGSNERDHAWMDEGLNSYYEARHVMHKYPDTGVLGRDKKGLEKKLGIEGLDYWGRFELAYLFNARRGLDQSIELPSEEFTPTNYGTIVYAKTALVLKHLAAYLGQERYDTCMETYFDRWKFKHPMPADLRACFEEVSGEDLSWVFDDMINTTKKVDRKLKWGKNDAGQKELKAKNAGSLAAPFSIKLDSTIWFSSETEWTGITPSNTKDLIFSDPKHFTLDLQRKNDRIRSNGNSGRGRPFQLKAIGGVERSDRSQLFWSPIMGWNDYDKWMLGAAFYNTIFPSQKFEYVIAPMYSFGTKDLAGSAKMAYNINHTSNKFIYRSRIGAGARRYAVWNDRDFIVHANKVSPFIETVARNSVSDHRSHKLRFEMDAIWEQYAENLEEGGISNSSDNNVFLGLNYTYLNAYTLTPYMAKIKLLQHEEFVSLSLEAKFRHHYNKKKKSVGVRMFAGTFLWEEIKNSRYTWNMSGIKGKDDYRYTGVYLGRNESEGVLSQQFLDQQGAFKAPTAFGQSDSWLFAMNFDLDIPFPIPIALFADIGVAPITNVAADGSKTSTSATYYDFGISFPIIRNIFEIWMPLGYAEDIKNEFEFKDLSFGEQIRFTLKLELLDPFEQLRNLNP